MSDPLEKELKALQNELTEYSGQLLEITRELLKERVTEFPVFIAHQTDVSLGEIIIDLKEYEVPYSISVSTVEEFVEAGLIQKEKLSAFSEAFGNPVNNMCVFWVHGDNARYILFPFAGRNTDTDS
jgi:anion-transporting  ArsA/GET3 family ATPase